MLTSLLVVGSASVEQRELAMTATVVGLGLPSVDLIEVSATDFDIQDYYEQAIDHGQITVVPQPLKAWIDTILGAAGKTIDQVQAVLFSPEAWHFSVIAEALNYGELPDIDKKYVFIAVGCGIQPAF